MFRLSALGITSRNEFASVATIRKNQRDQLTTHLFEIESQFKLCRILHIDYLLKKLGNALNFICREQIEAINSPFSDLKCIQAKSNDPIPRDPSK